MAWEGLAGVVRCGRRRADELMGGRRGEKGGRATVNKLVEDEFRGC